ncbi:MAG: hypothetical protein V4602_15605 [Pseudomonadota bacterium]
MIRITFNAPGLFAEALSQFDRGLAADQVLMLDDFERLDRLSAWCAEKEPAALLLHRVTAGGAARGKLGTIVRNCIGIIRVCVEGGGDRRIGRALPLRRVTSVAYVIDTNLLRLTAHGLFLDAASASVFWLSGWRASCGGNCGVFAGVDTVRGDSLGLPLVRWSGVLVSPGAGRFSPLDWFRAAYHGFP